MIYLVASSDSDRGAVLLLALEIEKLLDTSSKSVVKNTKRIFARFGIPQVLVSGNGPQFVNHEFCTFMSQWGVDHVVSSPHHPQGNGKAESAVKIA